MEELKEKLRKFAEDRNWNQFHNPKNLAMALGGEVGELLDIFQWLKEEESNLINVRVRKNVLGTKTIEETLELCENDFNERLIFQIKT